MWNKFAICFFRSAEMERQFLIIAIPLTGSILQFIVKPAPFWHFPRVTRLIPH